VEQLERDVAMKKILTVLLITVTTVLTVSGIAFKGTYIETAIVSEATGLSLAETMLPYYYSLMSDAEKDFYIELRSAVINMQSTVTLKGFITGDTLDKLVKTMFYFDELTFNLSSYSGKTYTDRAEVVLKYSYTKESYDRMLDGMDKIADEIIDGFGRKDTTYDKIRYIHDYIINTADYDENEQTAHYAYGAMVRNSAVCEGYAHAFAYTCAKAGITTVNVIGTADGVAHMWNKVYYLGKWYNVDLTWDDPVSNYVENTTYDYFMVSDEMIGRTHTVSDCSYTIPAAADNSMTYYSKNRLIASSNEDAAALLAKQIAKAASNGKRSAAISLADESTYKSFMTYISSNNSEKMLDILKKAYKRTNVKLITAGYKGKGDDSAYSYTVMVLCEGTTLSDYYRDISQVDYSTRSFFRQLGIKTYSYS
jgi:hypothetical protein